MKNILLLLSISFFLISCNKQENNKEIKIFDKMEKKLVFIKTDNTFIKVNNENVEIKTRGFEMNTKDGSAKVLGIEIN